MSFTYLPEKLYVEDLHTVRFLIQDTIEDKKFLEDEEIQATLTQYSDDINKTCASLCRAIAARFVRESDVRVSTYTTLKNSVYEKYLALARDFERRTAKSTHFIVPSISKSEKAIVEANTDRVEPAFTRGMFDNPPSSSSSSDDDE